VAQILGTFFEFHVIFLAILPWWGVGIGVILVDIIWDYLWYLIFFSFCKPCAYVFVWILNIAMLPIHVFFWYQRLMLEIVGFALDFWTLFFNGDGCFLRWGNDCWFARKMYERGHLEYTDLVWLAVKQPAFLPKGIAFGDEANSWYKAWGFPGGIDEFERDMNRRRKSIGKALESGNGHMFGEFVERVAMFTDQLAYDMREVFDF